MPTKVEAISPKYDLEKIKGTWDSLRERPTVHIEVKNNIWKS